MQLKQASLVHNQASAESNQALTVPSRYVSSNQFIRYSFWKLQSSHSRRCMMMKFRGHV